MARIIVPAGWKSVDDVIAEAFKALGCERWGGPTEHGWSKITDLQRCAYRYYLKHVAELVPASLMPESSPALEIGSYTHLVLAAHYASFLPDSRYPGYRFPCPTPEAIFAALDVAGAEPMALQEARLCWAGYVEHWGADGWAPLGVEMWAGIKSVHTCRYDLIASIEDGIHDGIWAVDHKTLSPKADVELYGLDGEIMGEALCWKLFKLEEVFGQLEGVCINVLFKGKPPRGMQPYYRKWIPFNDELIAEFERNRAYWQSQIEMFARRQFFPKSHYGCVARYDKCLFWEHCATLNPALLTPKVRANG